MSATEKPEPTEVLQRLLLEYKTASLATVSGAGLPHASYVPIATHAGCFLFFVSELSEHTANLRESRQASLMLIEDEGRTEQLFARNRATFSGAVQHIERQSPEWDAASTAYGERFGKFFEMLTGLKDFHMFSLSPQDIRLVVGFGAAYRVSGEKWDQLELQTGR